jgi:hypothetical protein
MEESIQPKKGQGSRKIVSLVLFIIIFLAIAFFVWTQYIRWYGERKIYIESGLAEDHFPYRIYTERELAEKGRMVVESQELMNVPTRTTPEETYATFRQALIDWDVDKAISCFTKEKQAEYRIAMLKAKEEGRIQGIIEKLKDISPEGQKVTKGSTGDASTSYELLYKEKESDIKFISHSIGFVKDWNGDWKMENL